MPKDHLIYFNCSLYIFKRVIVVHIRHSQIIAYPSQTGLVYSSKIISVVVYLKNQPIIFKPSRYALININFRCYISISCPPLINIYPLFLCTLLHQVHHASHAWQLPHYVIFSFPLLAKLSPFNKLERCHLLFLVYSILIFNLHAQSHIRQIKTLRCMRKLIFMPMK